MAESRQLFCLNILSYRKSDISQKVYHDYMVNTHAALVGKLLEKYGVVRWTMNHPTDLSRQMASKIYDEQFANYADYDCIVQIVFPEVDCFVRMKEDPYYKEFIKPDHDKFADTARSKITIGLFEEIIDNGKLIRS